MTEMKIVASDKYGVPGSDWFQDECLLKSENPTRYILRGKGGKFTKYTGGSKEFELSEEKALAWLEKHYETMKLGG